MTPALLNYAQILTDCQTKTYQLLSETEQIVPEIV